MKKTLLYLGRLFFTFCASVLLYLFFAFIGTIVPYYTTSHKSKETIPVFILSNDFHTDLIIPLQNEHIDWLSKIDSVGFEQYRHYQYLALGWGDKGFYMESFDNQFPTLLTSLNAIFLPSESLIHVAFYQDKILENEYTAKLSVTNAQLKKLIDFAQSSFELSEHQKFTFYSKGYGQHDYFFKAKGSYHLFRTCNQWTNEALATAHLPSSLWSPFAQGVMWRVRD